MIINASINEKTSIYNFNWPCCRFRLYCPDKKSKDGTVEVAQSYPTVQLYNLEINSKDLLLTRVSPTNTATWLLTAAAVNANSEDGAWSLKNPFRQSKRSSN